LRLPANDISAWESSKHSSRYKLSPYSHKTTHPMPV